MASSVLARGASWLFLRAPRGCPILPVNGSKGLGRVRAGLTASHARSFSLVDRVPGEGAPVADPPPPQAEKVSVQWTVGDEQSTSKKCDPYEQGGKHLSREQAEENRTQVPSPRFPFPGSLTSTFLRTGTRGSSPRARTRLSSTRKQMPP